LPPRPPRLRPRRSTPLGLSGSGKDRSDLCSAVPA
jgi:hypothetical protein